MVQVESQVTYRHVINISHALITILAKQSFGGKKEKAEYHLKCNYCT